MNDNRIEVIATTISGSIRDWGKVKMIIPLFREYGWKNVFLREVDSHAEARELVCDLVARGNRTLISAGGSGTFNSVLEGCIDSQVGLGNITLGFLRKGSADLIGKTLGMPDEIHNAVKVFVKSLNEKRTIKCDVIQVKGGKTKHRPRHFVGYGGAEIFGRIPHYSENKFIKYYKGVLGQVFGDLGPFFVSASISVIEKVLKKTIQQGKTWMISVDGREVAKGLYQAMIIVNGDLGPDFPFAKSVPLGSGDFYLFGIRDLGVFNLPSQFKHAWDSSILDRPEKWGFESYRIKKELKIELDRNESFPINVDGSTMSCVHSASFRITDQINLISK